MDTPLARLCRYYLDCLAVDGLDGVSVLESGVDVEYVELASNPLVSAGGLTAAFEQVEVRRLLKRMLQKKQACDLLSATPYSFIKKRTGTEKGSGRAGEATGSARSSCIPCKENMLIRTPPSPCLTRSPS